MSETAAETVSPRECLRQLAEMLPGAMDEHGLAGLTYELRVDALSNGLAASVRYAAREGQRIAQVSIDTARADSLGRRHYFADVVYRLASLIRKDLGVARPDRGAEAAARLEAEADRMRASYGTATDSDRYRRQMVDGTFPPPNDADRAAYDVKLRRRPGEPDDALLMRVIEYNASVGRGYGPIADAMRDARVTFPPADPAMVAELQRDAPSDDMRVAMEYARLSMERAPLPRARSCAACGSSTRSAKCAKCGVWGSPVDADRWYGHIAARRP